MEKITEDYWGFDAVFRWFDRDLAHYIYGPFYHHKWRVGPENTVHVEHLKSLCFLPWMYVKNKLTVYMFRRRMQKTYGATHTDLLRH